jgi:type II secretory pathway component PulM
MTTLSKRVARLTRRDRRAMTIGAMLVLPAVAFHLVVRPYRNALADVRSRVVQEQDLLHRERALLAEVKAYPSRLQRAEATLLREAPRLFAGPDLTAASAALSNYVGGKALASHVFVQRSETESPSPAAGVAQLQVELNAVGDLEGILSFLQSLESGPKLVTVHRLGIGKGDRVSIGEPRDDEVLSLTAIVGGYALSEPAPAAVK